MRRDGQRPHLTPAIEELEIDIVERVRRPVVDHIPERENPPRLLVNMPADHRIEAAGRDLIVGVVLSQPLSAVRCSLVMKHPR
ncbi:MAG: hypothetical protein GY713_12875 [Actinomycetia bacterium]|nr:hypothetical protein [Actinomycetes bacterium]